MKVFRTPLAIPALPFSLHVSDPVLTMGSCFAEAIGSRLENYKVNSLSNPFGTIYNPISIHKALNYAVKEEFPSTDTYLKRQDIHLNYDFHSHYAALSQDILRQNIEESIIRTHHFIKNTTVLIITYGTAWVYAMKNSKQIVANCHKMPGNLFDKFLLQQKSIIHSFEEVLRSIKKVNPKVKVILTVSPVRHIKDTLALNSVSKSVLRLSCHTLSESIADVHYFPAYEIMMDDLRDYRFYKKDMIHPTEEAEDYIWESFLNACFNTEARQFFEKWKSVLQAMQHRPFHPTSEGNQRFLQDTLRKLEELKPIVNVDKEVTLIKNQLK